MAKEELSSGPGAAVGLGSSLGFAVRNRHCTEPMPHWYLRSPTDCCTGWQRLVAYCEEQRQSLLAQLQVPNEQSRHLVLDASSSAPLGHLA